MLAFEGEAEAAGAMIVLRPSMLSGRVCGDGFDLAIGGDEPTSSIVVVSSTQPGSMHLLSPGQSTGYRGRRSRRPISVEGCIFR